ncbi:DNA-binding transcriptional regulator, CsgD family [Streptoalloteichus tenebrarius]|uniref:DNA-binding transcriptional regulator, CsgD family n=1 Tax=Streptoalloteichus tenebrarius (strain ATCC 17920 / DSM 40477 / JCM 4838 / CBS 697.72 / NBRC 16177 / NCIMB 11028 / NRRL B-12390 / A12253. 1 / ISP 5477) TaxID=1933 RepID=A0ABT1HWP5_STRSD|nr:helix-turn-helix transcriptional regulator [Streptoalloteichus tenebrarius]MCP2259820.1 DNA-binding transcriptional regulator, CsgD family [Streptoalloteichus tenebrarius]BFE99230.1 LuxR C-terminal-related transcriptional regulator [Streptoalloteichus tenebrarius]
MRRSGERLLRELPEAARQRLDLAEVGEVVSHAIAAEVPHDGVRLLATCPSAGLPMGSFSFWHGYEPEFGRELLRGYYLGDDPVPPEALARRSTPLDVLGPDHRLLTEHEIGSELRLLLRDDSGVWGVLGLTRAEGRDPFDRGDACRAADLARPLMAALREYVRAGPLAPVVPPLPAGVIVLGPDHRVRAVTPQAFQWLERLRGGRPSPEWIAESFLVGLSSAARRGARGPLAGATAWGPPITHGRWVTYQGQPLDADGVGDVAVVIQAATGPQLLPVLCDWYGISHRERQIVEDLYDGAAPKQVARRRGLSVHTVNDHLKSVFRKTGAGGRDELIAAVTG